MVDAGAAFDQLAGRYDECWTTTPAGRLQRDAVWRNVANCFRAHDEVLDLGCGTGEDAAWLNAGGVRVTAIDASPAMVAAARNRGLDAQILKIEELDRLSGRFNGALSNFGAFNCIEKPERLRSILAARFLPGAHLAICVMGKFCLWETLWFLLKGKFRKAARRWGGSAPAETLGIPVTYHSLPDLRRALTPDFALIAVRGVGIAVPPSYVTSVPAACFKFLGWLDRSIERLPLVSALADHRLLIFRRK
jgi:SAM-dependent methyltransferase